MLERRIALAGVVVIVAGLGAVPAAWADTVPPPPTPKPHLTGHSGDAIVCHDYPGAFVTNKNGHFGSPDPSQICLD